MPRNYYILLITLVTLSACNTVKGIGKDIQSAGQAIEQEAEEENF